MLRNFLVVTIVFILCACSTGQATTISSNKPIGISNNGTSIPISTVTPTALPVEMKNEILQAYKLLLFIQIDANLIQETANRVNSGELSKNDSGGLILAIATLAAGLDEEIAGIKPTNELRTQLNQAVAIHYQTKSIIHSWFMGEIDSSAVLDEIKKPITDMENIISSADEVLSTMYGFDPNELQKVRDDAIASINQVLNTPTPTP
jgi:hypothetical protein